MISVYLTRTFKDPKEGKEEEITRLTNALAYPPHITHTSVYISFSISAHTCVFPYWRTSRTPKSHAT
jgi:hypothetical protein